MRRMASAVGMLGMLALAGMAWAQEPQPAPPAALAIGAVAPMTDVKLAGVNGKSVTLADMKGKNGTLVVFTCNACPFAKAWESRIVELGNTYAKRGVGVIAVNSNDPAVQEEDAFAVMQTRAKERKMAFPYVVDETSNLARAFGATRTPEAFLFDRNGKLVYHGAIDDNKDAGAVKDRYLRNALEAAVTGKAVATSETKSMGCGIKFRSKSASS